MAIEDLREKNKDSFISTEVVCPHCGKTFIKLSPMWCTACHVKIFFRNEDGYTALIDPKAADKSRKFTLTDNSGNVSEHYAGELIEMAFPFLTDCDMSAYADGEELYIQGEGGELKTAFLMPPRDVKVECRYVNSMQSRNMTGFTGMGNMGMGGMKP